MKVIKFRDGAHRAEIVAAGLARKEANHELLRSLVRATGIEEFVPAHAGSVDAFFRRNEICGGAHRRADGTVAGAFDGWTFRVVPDGAESLPGSHGEILIPAAED